MLGDKEMRMLGVKTSSKEKFNLGADIFDMTIHSSVHISMSHYLLEKKKKKRMMI